MTSLYGTFQYFDDSQVDLAMRLYYQEKTGYPSYALPPRPPPPPPPAWIQWLQTYHPTFLQLAAYAGMEEFLWTNSGSTTLFIFPEAYLDYLWQCDLSSWEVRKLLGEFWLDNYFPPCFLMSQSPIFNLYNHNYQFIKCRQTQNGLMYIENGGSIVSSVENNFWVVDVCGSSFYQDETHIFYPLMSYQRINPS